MIYLDNAATSFPKPEAVYQAIDHFNRHIGASPGRGSYGTAREAERIVSTTRGLLAQLFHVADPSRIVFTANATEALNLALKGVLRPADHVITTVTEHNSILRPLHSLARDRQVKVTRVPCDGCGRVDPADIARALRPDTRLVCMTHASNVTGAIHDIGAIGRLVHGNGTLFMVDSAQTAGCVPIDVVAMQVDLLAFTGHKSLLGPQGTGGLYMAPDVEVQPFREGGTGSDSASDRQPDRMPDRFEGGTLNTLGLAGLGAGVRHILDVSVERIQAQEAALSQYLLDSLVKMPGLKVYGPPPGTDRVAVASFTLESWPPLNLAHLLGSAFDVATRSGIHCASLIHRYIGTADSGTLRVSLGPFNTRQDIDAFLSALQQISAT